MIAGDLAEALRTACAEVGVVCCEVPADGRWYAADLEGDAGGRGDGRIKLFVDGEGGIVVNWKEDQRRVFFIGNGRKLTEPERLERDGRREEAIREARAEEQRRHAEARAQAAAIWRAAQPATDDHPYLARKGVKAVATLRELPADQLTALLSYIPKSKGEPLSGRVLIVPIKVNGELASLELIDEAGRKSALAGGVKRGGYWATHALPEEGGDGLTLVLGEGVATCASASEASGHLAVAALSSTNLEPIAQYLRARFPGAKLIILADLLKETSEPDPHALAAARMVEALLAVPQFADLSSGPTDFNDLHRLEGAEAVRRCMSAAKPVGAPRAEVTSSEWPEPRPIRAALYPVPGFDAETLLPEALRGWVMDEADRMPCPPDFIAAAVLVGLAALIGARCAIQPKRNDDWFNLSNLWGGIVAPPRGEKTPAINKALNPLDRLITQAFKTHEKDLELYKGEKLLFDARKEAIENRLKAAAKGKKDENLESVASELREHQRTAPDAPVLKRYKTNDATVEKLGELLGNLALFASCERAAEAGSRGGKLSRIRSSQPLGSVTRRRELEGKISECNEVKDGCPESEP